MMMVNQQGLFDVLDLVSFKYDDCGLLFVVVQGNVSGVVLMVVWVNCEVVEKMIEIGYVYFYSCFC